MEILGRTGCFHHAEFIGKCCIEGADPAFWRLHASEAETVCGGEFEVSRLGEGMNPRISPPRTVDGEAFPDDPADRILQGILHCSSPRLTLPTPEGCAIVGEKKADFHGCPAIVDNPRLGSK